MNDAEPTGLLRAIPSVDRLLAGMADLGGSHPRASVVRAVRTVLEDARRRIREGDLDRAPSVEELTLQVLRTLETTGLRRVINATGIVAHTGLGRSVLPPDALAAIAEEARGYCLLAVDRFTTKRADRFRFVEELLIELTGAEAAIVVNNNAAATMIMLNTMAEGKEVIISRGQLVEIGGSFRIPDVLVRSGARLVEVGATNRTHLRDYENAITDNTGLLMRVHTSNYRIVGFAKEVPIEELAALGRARGIPVVDDLGAGAFLDLRPYGFPEEPMVAASVAAGADLVSMSTDKLIGGPQGGIIAGRKELVDRIHKNPLYRAFRVGKLTLVALEATLRYFLDHQRAFDEHPTTRMLTRSLTELETCAKELAAAIGEAPGLAVEVIPEHSEVGSGSYPAHQIPTFVVALTPIETRPDDFALALRKRPVAVFTRVKNDRILLDPRTLQPGEGLETAAAVREVAGGEV
jgi:L-seryl-tRNA(Ser) seleniumtransferase